MRRDAERLEHAGIAVRLRRSSVPLLLHAVGPFAPVVLLVEPEAVDQAAALLEDARVDATAPATTGARATSGSVRARHPG